MKKHLLYAALLVSSANVWSMKLTPKALIDKSLTGKLTPDEMIDLTSIATKGIKKDSWANAKGGFTSFPPAEEISRKLRREPCTKHTSCEKLTKASSTQVKAFLGVLAQHSLSEPEKAERRRIKKEMKEAESFFEHFSEEPADHEERVTYVGTYNENGGTVWGEDNGTYDGPDTPIYEDYSEDTFDLKEIEL